MKSSNKEKQLRATFKDTKKAQEKLRELLEELEEKNIGIENKKEYFELLADSLLGFDFEKQCILYLPDETILRISNLGKFLRELAYTSKINFNFLRRHGKISNSKTDLKNMWHELKFEIFAIYPEALNFSVKISKEQIRFGASESAEV